MSFSNICLLCLHNSDGLFEIFGKRGIELNAAAILKVHFWFELSETDEKGVCEKCWWTVHHFHVFYNSVKLNHQNQSIFDVKSVVIGSTEQNELPALLDAIKDEPLNHEDQSIFDVNLVVIDSTEHNELPALLDGIKDEQLNHQHQSIFDVKSDVINFMEHNELPALLDAIKHEPNIDIENDLDECSPDLSYIPYSSDARESHDESERHHVTDHAANHTTDSPTITRRKRQTERTTVTRSPMKFKTEGHNVTDHAPNHTTDKPTTTGRKRQTERTTSVSTSPKKHKTDSHTLLLSTYFKMACDLCDTVLSSYRDTKNHYKNVHNINTGYLICCRKKFVRLEHMLQHCQWHMNPESFKCSFCQKCFNDKIILRHHIRNVHSPETEREFQCEICKKSFAKSYLLRSHMKVNHIKDEDKQFECHICKRRYVVLSFLKRHINMVHRNVHSHICEVCAKPFKSGNACKMHYVTFHTNISQKVQCDKCGKWLKHKESLKKHFLMHNSKTATCEICGRVSSNIRALHTHITRTHREASLECTICGKMFKKQQVLKEHMAIHAGNTDLYTCTFCTRTFRSSANMYSHRKRAHPVELEQKKASLNCFTPATVV